MGNELIPSDAVKAIQDSVGTGLIVLDDISYVTRPIYAPPVESTPVSLRMNTLTGISDFMNKGVDELEGVMFHVVSERQVDVVGPIFGRSHQRKTFATTTADVVLSKSEFHFGEFYDVEQFIIKLQSLFAPTFERGAVLALVGNIKEEKVRTTSDDGVTQSVIARSGIANVTEVQVPNPVTLAPFRTFREIEQPTSPFILRVKQGKEGGLPTVALFEADGGEWKLTAIASIRRFLEEAVEGVAVIA